MTQTLSSGTVFDPTTTFVDDIFEQVVPPSAYLSGAPTSIGAHSGTSSWGIKNSPQLYSTPQQLFQLFGTVQPAAITDVHDLVFDGTQALNQANGNSGLSIYGIRTTDGTDTAATLQLNSDEAVEETITFGGTATNLDIITVTMASTAPIPAFVTFSASITISTSEAPSAMATAMAAAITALVPAGSGITAVAASTAVDVAWPNTLGPITFSTNAAGKTETVTFASTALAGITLTAKYTGSLGNNVSVYLQAGSVPNTTTFIVIPFNGGGPSEVFTNIPSSTGPIFWAALKTALLSGQSPARGPSNWLVPSSASSSALLPLYGQFFLAAGTDGRSVTSANLVGANVDPVSGQPTGIYTLQSVQFNPSVLWISGLSDTTVYTQIQAFVDKFQIVALLTFPSGTSVTSAVSTKQSVGISDYQVVYIYQWVWVSDQYNNNNVRLVPPCGVAAGAIASLNPEVAPFNKNVFAILGTERTNPYSGNYPFSYSELNQLGQAGICPLATIAIGGIGFRNDYNSIGANQTNAVIEYSRLTNFLVESSAQILAPFRGQHPGTSPNDLWRANVSSSLNNFYGGLGNRIDSFTVLCNQGNNPNTSVSQHVGIVQQLVRYNASVLKILDQINGGTSVQTSVNGLGFQVNSTTGALLNNG